MARKRGDVVLFVFDGTGNTRRKYRQSNAYQFMKAYRCHPESELDPFYTDGVGTGGGLFKVALGGLTGLGAKKRVRAAYSYLCAESENKRDDEIVLDVIGFSRGAATAIHFTNVVAHYGIRSPKREWTWKPYHFRMGWVWFRWHKELEQTPPADKKEPQRPKVRVRFLGLWDVVAAFGFPVGGLKNLGDRFRSKLKFFDLGIPSIVDSCYHAVALDEIRRSFDVHHPKPTESVTTVWFGGVHTNVGGSAYEKDKNDRLGIRQAKPLYHYSDIALVWMIQKARQEGLTLDTRRFRPAINESGQEPKLREHRVLLPKGPRPICQHHRVIESAWEDDRPKGKSRRLRNRLYSWKSDYRPIGEESDDCIEPTPELQRDLCLEYPKPELRSNGVHIREWSLGDLGCVEAASADPEIRRRTTLPAEYSKEEGRAWIKRQWSRHTSGQGLSMAIAGPDENDEAKGLVYLGPSPMKGHCELEFWLIPGVRRQGLGTAAVRIVSRWVLRKTEVDRLVACVEPDNVASIALLRKCGFTEEGLLRSYLRLDDGVFDAIAFSLLKTDVD